jgi:membrane associated rhomboid family serine protease
MSVFRSFQQSGARGFRIGPGSISPFIKAMLIANGAVFLIQFMYPSLPSLLGLTPAAFFAQFPNLIYQTFSYMFVHADFWHIFFNMIMLWMFGTEIEYTWGTRKFAQFYILAGLSGAILTLVFQSGQAIPIVGASAAIYGVFIAYWIMFPNRMLYLYFMFPVKVKWAIPGMMLLGFLMGRANVAHLAHLGGALFGLIYMKFDWRLLKFSDKLKGLRYQRQNAKLQKNRQKAVDVMKRVDSILDKINDVGIENLSRSERKFLEDASSELSEKKTNK